MPLQYEQYAHLLHPEGHNNAVTAVNFSPSGRLLASAGLDGRVCVWQVSCGDLLYVFSGKSAVLSVVWVGSDMHLVCGMEDGTIAFLAILTVRRASSASFIALHNLISRLMDSHRNSSSLTDFGHTDTP